MVRYCYRIVVVYPPRSATGQIIFSDISESIASIEVCDNIILSSPVITKVSVTKTSTTQGKIGMAYVTPKVIDTMVYAQPYRIVLKRKATTENAYTTLASFNYNAYNAMLDGIFTDSLLNTTQNQYKNGNGVCNK